MKHILLLLIGLMAYMDMSAQCMILYKNGKGVDFYNQELLDSVKLSKAAPAVRVYTKKDGVKYYTKSQVDSVVFADSIVHIQSIKIKDLTPFYKKTVLDENNVSTLCTISPANATIRKVGFRTHDSDIAYIGLGSDGEYYVYGLKGGKTKIQATAGDSSHVIATNDIEVLDHRVVDLGLPSGTLWAVEDIGADTVYRATINELNVKVYVATKGKFYSWGGTEGASSNLTGEENKYHTPYTSDELLFNMDSYKFHTTGDKFTKYVCNSKYGTVDNKKELDATDDIATITWGDQWQMPSEEQIKELMNNTYCGRMSVSGTDEYQYAYFRNMNAQNYLVFPCTGYRAVDDTGKGVLIGAYTAGEQTEDESKFTGSSPYFWSRTMVNDPTDNYNTINAYYGYSIVTYPETNVVTKGYTIPNVGDISRVVGCTVRPVLVTKKKSNE